MRIFLLVSIALLLGEPVTAQDRTRVMGYETYAVVAPIDGEANARPLAEQHCAKYDRFAHFRRMDGVKAIFDCGPRRVDKKPSGTGSRGIY